jgi:CoA:oxalate CoA-transferase
MAEAVKQNLTGLRVLDITQYIAGPTLGRILADMGADVVKLEMPPGGEFSRAGSVPEPVEGQAPTYIYYNRGKRSLCIDFKRPEGAAIVVELARHFDVIIENYTPGVLSKYGLSYEAFKAVNPRVIMCSVSGFGQKGPRANLPGNDMTGQAFSGLLSLTGNDDGTSIPGCIWPTAAAASTARPPCWRRCMTATAPGSDSTSTWRFTNVCSTSTTSC